MQSQSHCIKCSSYFFSLSFCIHFTLNVILLLHSSVSTSLIRSSCTIICYLSDPKYQVANSVTLICSNMVMQCVFHLQLPYIPKTDNWFQPFNCYSVVWRICFLSHHRIIFLKNICWPTLLNTLRKSAWALWIVCLESFTLYMGFLKINYK